MLKIMICSLFFFCIEWKSCKDGEWQCNNKQCIHSAKRCDVTTNCFDESDEKDCGIFTYMII